MLLSASVYAVADDTGNAAQIESTPILQSSYNQSFSDSGSMAYVKNSENAYSGSYCLAFGFEEPQADQSGTVLPINTAVDFRLAEVGNSGAAPLSTGDELRFSSPNNGGFKYSVAV